MTETEIRERDLERESGGSDGSKIIKIALKEDKRMTKIEAKIDKNVII